MSDPGSVSPDGEHPQDDPFAALHAPQDDAFAEAYPRPDAHAGEPGQEAYQDQPAGYGAPAPPQDAGAEPAPQYAEPAQDPAYYAQPSPEAYGQPAPDAGYPAEAYPAQPAAEVPPAGATVAAPRSGAMSDPVVRGLVIAIIVIIILFLVSVISAMMWGLLSPPASPRTATERDIMVYGAQVQGGNTDTRTYAQYVAALIAGGEYAKAQDAIDSALKVAKSGRSFLYDQQAQLDLAQRDYAGAVVAAEKAMTEAQKELKAFEDNNVAGNRARTAGAVMPDSFTDAALAKATALQESKQYAAAIKALDAYIKLQPTDSDVLVQRASLKVLVGDKKGAAADYRAALKYIPDYRPALDGLKKIGATR